jgi:hypothetical protein
MGEIPQPEDVHGKSYDTYYYDATHFPDYEKAKANFELVKESYKDLDYSGIQFKEEAFREAKAVEQGDANAQPNAGSSSFIGQRVTQNDMPSIALFRKTATQGHGEAKDFFAKTEAAAQKRQQWEEQGLCTYCGGKLGGLFTKKCKSCGKKN